jgi:endonuclease YncB( thermonuclease family)
MPFFASSYTIFDTAHDIPGDYLKSKTEIRAVVQHISDGDTFRVRHIVKPSDERYSGSLKHHTIIIRAAAVDAPEIAKQGKNGQPFSQEAKRFAEDKLLNKKVKVKLLSRDQYGRIVGLVKYKDGGFWGFFQKEKDFSEELLRRGLAVVYRQGGGHYDGSIKRWDAIEVEAIKYKRGLWKNGKERVQLPSDFKKTMKAERANIL